MSTEGQSYETKVALVESNSRPSGQMLVNTYMVNRNADPMDLVELAKQVQKADEFTKATAGSKLMVIADQIRYLQEQAKKVLEEAKRDAMLHHAACNLVKKPGKIYYLYERESGQNYFSILSPEEWGASCPHEFVGAFKLEYDMSWTPAEYIEQRSQDFALIDKVMNAQKAIVDAESPNFKGLTPESRNNSSAKLTDISHITGYDTPKDT
ncbi:uncharacterized protein C1orf50 homolog isoform X1 [Mercenaria mercenaria]|uniref:uncharacterized protein C1orf50 homolog isoform X1 n=2 Tax=Mercenaria mercenaria TaxID=6596 RepID=UPI00234E50AB|nr:uncharacterized protein C1orf50 homolog isoform X1 [Mercenaria mercenaria]